MNKQKIRIQRAKKYNQLVKIIYDAFRKVIILMAVLLLGIMIGFYEGQENLSENLKDMLSGVNVSINSETTCEGIQIWNAKDNIYEPLNISRNMKDGFYRYYDSVNHRCDIKFIEVTA